MERKSNEKLVSWERSKCNIARHISYEENHRNNNGILEKKCTRHIINFPEEDSWFPCTDWYFYKTKNKTDGLNTYCKKCTGKNAEYWRENNREKWLDINIKTNKRPEKDKARREASKKHRENGGYLKWQQNNPDKIKLYNSDRQHKNHKISKKEWIDCKNYFDNKCAYCGLPLEEHWIVYRGIRKLGDFQKEHKDHYGINNLSNCIPSCKSCNDKKWKHEFDDWYNQDNPLFSQERLNKINMWLNEDYKLYIKIQ